jgi:DNA-binding NarL/FixJ family response regulator
MNAVSPAKYRVLIVDDHPIVRHGLAELIAADPGLEVCGEAAGVDEALAQVEAACPHVVVVDLSLKSGHGIDLIERIKARYEHVKMLVSSVHDEEIFAERALRAGAMGYVNKEEATETVIEAIHHVLKGKIFLSESMSNRLLRTMVDGPLDEDPIKGLSNRELEVFEMIGQGLTTKQIAKRLCLSPKTIETHREKIKIKLNLANSTELSHRAVQWLMENR